MLFTGEEPVVNFLTPSPVSLIPSAFPQLSLSPYELKANKFEGMRDFSPEKR
jgi:hypothetical protein